MRRSVIRSSAFPLMFSVLAALAGCASQGGAIASHTAADGSPKPIDIDFRDFYKTPIGPRGLEPTARLLGMKGQRVRIKGYMVQEEEPEKGFFMVAPMPVNIPEKEDGPSDDLPGSTVFVHMPKEDADKILAFRPGLWELVGTLELGGKEEANGRISYIRLMLDQPASQEAVKTSEITGSRTAAN